LSAILALKNSTASPLITFKLFSCLICALLIIRKIQSFVKRSGRLTPAQKKGLTELWDDYAKTQLRHPSSLSNYLVV
jgi:hypothetical protein